MYFCLISGHCTGAATTSNGVSIFWNDHYDLSYVKWHASVICNASSLPHTATNGPLPSGKQTSI